MKAITKASCVNSNLQVGQRMGSGMIFAGLAKKVCNAEAKQPVVTLAL